MSNNFKVKCIKDDAPGMYLTKGKTYEFINGVMKYDNGFEGRQYENFEQYKRDNHDLGICLELIQETPTIVIYVKDNETIATLKQGKEVLKSAKAKIGAKLAFLRLVGEKEKQNSFNWDGFKKGEFAVHCDTEEKAREFLEECDVSGIKWCTGARPIAEQKETRWETFKNNTSYSCDYRGGLVYGTADKKNIVKYTPTTPQVKEVKRHANPNEYIEIVNEFSTDGKYKNGDILKVKYCHSRTAVTVSEFEFPGIADTEYFVLENYQPPIEDKTLADFTKLEIIEELFRRCKEE